MARNRKKTRTPWLVLDADGEWFEWLINPEVCVCAHRLREVFAVPKAATEVRFHAHAEPSRDTTRVLLDDGYGCNFYAVLVPDAHNREVPLPSGLFDGYLRTYWDQTINVSCDWR